MNEISGGRVNQKRRTRAALVETAARLMREGRSFTVGDVADAAMIGRTTAYRYFPTVDALTAHAALFAVTSVEQDDIARTLDGIDGADQRLSAVVAASDHSAAEHDHLYRMMLRTSLGSEAQDETMAPRLGGRRQALEAAVGGLRGQLGDKAYDRLVASLSLFLGIEVAIVMRDVCRLDAEEARDVKLWAARSLLESALAEAETKSRPKADRTQRKD